MLPGLFLSQWQESQKPATSEGVYIKQEPQDDIVSATFAPQFVQPDEQIEHPSARSQALLPAHADFGQQLAFRSRPLHHHGPDLLESRVATKAKPDDFGASTIAETALRRHELDGSRAPTECFQGRLALRPFEHVLVCGHVLVTNQPELCGSNCKLAHSAESKPDCKIPFICNESKCVGLRKAAKICFLPKKAGIWKTGSAAKQGLDNTARAKVERELAKLAIDGTGSLLATTAGLTRRRRAVEDSHFAKHDMVFGEPNERQRPNTYAARGRHSKRNQNADMFSIPEDTYADMIAEEKGVIIEPHDPSIDRLPRTGADVVPEEIDEVEPVDLTVVDDDDEERYCVCNCVLRSFMLKCAACKDYFHPGCIGKGLFVKERYDEVDAARAHRADVSHYGTEGFDFTCPSCDELGLTPMNPIQPMTGSRTKPRLRRKTDLATHFSKIVAEKCSVKAAAERRKNTLIDQLTSCSGCHKLIVGVRYHCVQCRNETIDFCTTCHGTSRHFHVFDTIKPIVTADDVEVLVFERAYMKANITGEADLVKEISTTKSAHGISSADSKGDVVMQDSYDVDDASAPVDGMEINSEETPSKTAWKPTRQPRYNTRSATTKKR